MQFVFAKLNLRDQGEIVMQSELDRLSKALAAKAEGDASLARRRSSASRV